MRRLYSLLLIPFFVSAAPNYQIDAGTVACKTLKTLNYAERIKRDEPVLEAQRAEMNNNCTTTNIVKPVTAFDIGVTAKVEFFALGRLDVYYIVNRDLQDITNEN